MADQIDFWLLLAGFGLFLFGMLQLEQSLKDLAGKQAKLFIRKHTTNKIKALFTGATVTALLQSSSVVTLMLLAFVGAELISLRNAISIILGSNFGTTLTGWLVATFGFKVNIEAFTIPMIAIGTLLMMFFQQKKTLKDVGRFFIGFGFLFMGLTYMKDGVEVLASVIDLSKFSDYPAVVFLLIALGFTALVQSSSLTMVIVLSALNAGIIGLTPAFAMVIGADIGTTVTVLLGSIKGTKPKKHVAYTHFIFNVVTDLIAFALLIPLQYFITEILSVHDYLYSTVLFHSLFNLIGILVFMPFVNRMADFFENRQKADDSVVSKYLSNVSTDVPVAAVEALSKEVEHLIKEVLILNLKSFKIYSFDEGAKSNLPVEMIERMTAKRIEFADNYKYVKELQGEIIEYFTALQNKELNDNESAKLNQLIYSVHNVMHASKDMKDIEHNLREFEDSINPFISQQFLKFHKQLTKLYGRLYGLLISENKATAFEDLIDHMNKNNQHHNRFNEKLFGNIKSSKLSEIEIATLMNVNKEIHSANKALIRSVKDLILTPDDASKFDAIPELHHYV